MATKKTRTLSADSADDFREIRRRVLGNGGRGGTAKTTATDAGGPYWLKITSSTLIDTEQWKYTCELYLHPWASGAIPGATVFARNAWELVSHAGYTVDAVLTGISPIVAGSFHKVEAQFKEDDIFYYVFTARNDPIIECPE